MRPCFLVVDREFPGSISTRKLVIETAKFNVITAYSGQEALEMLGRFPAIDGVVMDGELDDIPAEYLTTELKKIDATLPVLVICAPGYEGCPSADVQLESFQPQKLLEALRKLKPREAEQIEKHDEDISTERLN
ncbi:MAG: response regulator [Edaphobacter sp.]|uniref:response regulator n=1 Tax=Edaphobacter sp. TaxID=1934404 RepID=UPI0023A2FEE7|nr:response regulator [Edaphobacter sp.]MDE1177016.1 response regulator [Edaphobacter sp.]